MLDKQPEFVNEISVREGTTDEAIFKEVTIYDRLLEGCTAEDVVLDIGGNIGAFANRTLTNHPCQVICFEPDAENFDLLEKNTAVFGARCKKVRAALISGRETTIDFFLNVGKNKGAHSTRPTRGREKVTVPAANLFDWLAEIQPTIVKMDCEGSEYDLLQYELPSSVRAIAVEFHLNSDNWRDIAPQFHEGLLAQGFKATKEPTFGDMNWHTTGIYHR